jgi:predicted nucleic acid-binding Zn ribbon protein
MKRNAVTDGTGRKAMYKWECAKCGEEQTSFYDFPNSEYIYCENPKCFSKIKNPYYRHKRRGTDE